MKRLSILLLLAWAIGPAPAWADRYSVAGIAGWVEGASMGFTDANLDIRGLCYHASSNHIVISEDDGNEIAVLNAADYSTLRIITNVDTGDGSAVDPFRVGVTTDGQLFTGSYGGSVKRIGPDTTTDAFSSPVVIASASYPSGAAGDCRGLFVGGNYSEGTARIVTGRDRTVYIWRQAGAGSDVLSVAATIDTSSTYTTTGQIHGYWANADFSEILTFKQGEGIRKWTGSPGSGYTVDAAFSTPAIVTHRYSLDADPSLDLILLAGASNVATPGQMTQLATIRYSHSATIGSGTFGNTSFWQEPGFWLWGTEGASNTAAACAIDGVNLRAYGVSKAGLLVLDLEIEALAGVSESWRDYR